MIVIAIVTVAVAVVLVVVNVGRPNDPTIAPTGWEEPDLDAAEAIDLNDDEFDGVVVIAADEKTCWNGYIADKALEGCGNAYFKVTDAPAVLGVNASSKESEKKFLGLAVWDGDGSRLVDRIETNKRFGIVSLAAELPPDQ